MTDRELEEILARALDHAAPDDLEGVLSRCGERRGNVIMLEQTDQTVNTQKPARKFRWWMGLVAACLAVALVAGGAAGGMWYQSNRAVASVISLDVNPSIQLKVNQNERVIICAAMNEEAAAVLAEMDGGRDLEGSKLDVAVNAIVGALLRHGYLDDISSAILISVEDSNADRAARLQAQLTATVDGVLQNAASQAGVLSQTMDADAGLDAQAQANNISSGKAALVNQVLALNPSLDFEGLAALSVEELRDLILIGAPAMPIGRAAAVYAAAEYAGLLELDSVVPDADPELDDPTPCYEVELKTWFGEFDYTVDAFTGKVLSGPKDVLDTASAPQTTTPATADPAPQTTTAPVQTPAPAASAAPQTTPKPQTPAVTDIGVDAAKAAALKHAGLSGSQVTWVKAQRDYDDGRLEYELEFIYNSTEYEYTVLASNGSVIKYETEPVRGQSKPAPQPTQAPVQTPAPQTPAPTQAPATPAPTQAPAAPQPTTAPAVTDIGADAAKAAALAHAGLSAGQVTGMKCERDHEHGRIEYEIEFKCNGYEYEYTIDGATGSVLDHECDWDD